VYKEEMLRTELSMRKNARSHEDQLIQKAWPPPHQILAYDGKTYQTLLGNPGDKHLVLGHKPIMSYATGALDPFVVPYLWLFRKGDLFYFESMRNPVIWGNRFKDASLLSGDVQYGDLSLNCVLFQVHKAKPKRTFDIWFAKDLGYLPVHWIARLDDGKVVGEYITTKATSKPLEGGGVVGIPIKSTYTSGGAAGDANAKVYEISVLPSSVKINHVVDETIFRISPLLASEVVDVERHEKAVAESAAASKERLTGKSRTGATKWMLVLNILIVATLVSALLWRRKKNFS
jgi:hypothetical protein